MTNRREWVEFKIIYFKETGKYYTDAKYTYRCRMCEGTDTVYMYDILKHILELRNEDKALPGITSSWRNGYIFITCENGFPMLLKPKPGDIAEFVARYGLPIGG